MKHVTKYKADKNVIVTDGLYILFAEVIFVSASSLNLECITAELVVFSSLVTLTGATMASIGYLNRWHDGFHRNSS